MATIQLYLLENKSIQAKVNGYPYSYEGGYNIVAGDHNATDFEIMSIPTVYDDFEISVDMTNSRGQHVMPPEIVDNRKFKLPIGMAVAGYGQIVISARGKNSDGDNVTAYFLPLQIKVTSTAPNEAWKSGVINGTVSIGEVVTLPPDSKAYAVNVGTVNDAIINLGLPKGDPGAKGDKGDDPVIDSVLSTMSENPVQNKVVTEALNGKVSLIDWLDIMYPVGGNERYIQFPNAPTPAAKFAGTSWEIDTTMQGRTIIGSGGDYDFGTTGGSADAVVVSHTHKTYVSGVNLNENYTDPIASYAISSDSNLPYSLRNAGTIYNWKGTTNDVGENGTNKNMPPYIVINYWKRTA